MEKKKQPVVTMGTSSILVIFIILCLVTFAMLSLASSRASLTYAEKIADRTSDYYTACNRGEELLAEIQTALTEIPADTPAEYYQDAYEALKDMEGVRAKFPDPSRAPVISYQIPVNEDFILECDLEVVFPRQLQDPLCRIISWKEVSVKDWKPDDSLNLLDLEGE